ncbi:MAG: hypothetical protein KKB50_06800 [Planctomycetes bacterium]|nr:hypothetical protein [Planctomycetota bacterium]
MRMLMFVLAVLGVLVAQAGAEQFWITYEGNDLPENEGWTRVTYNGEAYRWIEDGALVIDSLHDPRIEDLANMERWMDPEPGELYVAEWRLLVDEGSGNSDAGVAIARSFEPGFVVFYFGPDLAWNGLDNLWWDIEPGVFHTYRFESYDVVDFDFFIDGQLVQEGTFQDAASNQSFISFGDRIDGQASLSRWDYVRFGVVPEPSAFVLALATLMLTFKVVRS